MIQGLNLAPLLATLALRQAAEAAMRRNRPSRKPRQGRASIFVWYIAYLSILALALERAWSTPFAMLPFWGYAVIWSGIALRLASLRALGAYYDYLILIRDDHRLVASGPYRWLRHPMHLGLHLEMAGLALLADGTLGWIAMALSLVALVQRNVQEERAMEEFFADAYRTYRQQTWDVIDLLPRSLKR